MHQPSVAISVVHDWSAATVPLLLKVTMVPVPRVVAARWSLVPSRIASRAMSGALKRRHC